jgi:hypothetical protein
MPMERSLIDKAVNGALLGKRKIGRPIRYNLRTKGKVGYVTDRYFDEFAMFKSNKGLFDVMNLPLFCA